jgi:hypothetical protein
MAVGMGKLLFFNGLWSTDFEADKRMGADFFSKDFEAGKRTETDFFNGL